MPKYTNAGGQPREKCIIAAYALVKNYGAKQADVAKVMGCSQSTIANWVKEAGYKAEIQSLRNDINAASDYIAELSNELRLIEYNPEDYPEPNEDDWE